MEVTNFFFVKKFCVYEVSAQVSVFSQSNERVAKVDLELIHAYLTTSVTMHSTKY